RVSRRRDRRSSRSMIMPKLPYARKWHCGKQIDFLHRAVYRCEEEELSRDRTGVAALEITMKIQWLDRTHAGCIAISIVRRAERYNEDQCGTTASAGDAWNPKRRC